MTASLWTLSTEVGCAQHPSLAWASLGRWAGRGLSEAWHVAVLLVCGVRLLVLYSKQRVTMRIRYM